MTPCAGIGAAHGYDTSMAHANDIPEGSLKFHWATFDPRRIANMTVDDDDILPSHHHLDGAHGVFGVIVAVSVITPFASAYDLYHNELELCAGQALAGCEALGP